MLLFSLMIFFLGLALGSFANCLIWRLYSQEKLSGRSHCPRCQHQLSWYDNIPLLSYVRLRGRCRHCRQSIAWQYPAVEAVVAILFIFFWFKHLSFSWLDPESLAVILGNYNFWLLLCRDFLASWVLTVVFVFDLRFYLISTLVILPAAAIFILLNILLGASWQTLLGTILATVIFFGLQFVLTRGRGLGEGDIWLGLMLGALFPDWSLLILAILGAYLIGTVVGLALMLTGHKSWGSKLPLGVFLALGAIIALAWGPAIISSYWRWF